MKDYFSRQEQASLRILGTPVLTVRTWEEDYDEENVPEDANWTRYGLFLGDTLILELSPDVYVDIWGDGGADATDCLALALARTLEGATK